MQVPGGPSGWHFGQPGRCWVHCVCISGFVGTALSRDSVWIPERLSPEEPLRCSHTVLIFRASPHLGLLLVLPFVLYADSTSLISHLSLGGNLFACVFPSTVLTCLFPCLAFEHSGKGSSFRQVVRPSLSHKRVALPFPFCGCLMSSLSLTSKLFTFKAPCVENSASVSLLS